MTLAETTGVDPRRIVAEAWDGAWRASALALALDRGLDAVFDPESDPVADVLASLGLIEPAPAGWVFVESARRAWIGRETYVADGLRAVLGRAASASFWGERGGWSSLDDEVLLANGRASSLTGARIAAAVTTLGLQGVFERGGSFLDVGTGVGAVGVVVARAYPRARVVGIDVFDRALALAAQEIKAAGLSDRFTLRLEGVDDLVDVDAFDLALVPVSSIPRGALEAGVPRVFRALRPGGWLLAVGFTGPGPEGALGRWQTHLANGAIMMADEFDEVARRAGLEPAVTVGAGAGQLPLFGWRRSF